MNGIDHPLVMVRDLEALRARCEAIGFTMTPVSMHPWGTATSLAVFENCLLEVMGVGDADLLGRVVASGLRFGRLLADQLEEREGISLVALHSRDVARDEAVLAGRGIAATGRIDFGRDVVLPDGREDRTATSLLVLYDPALPRLSHFLCQQHRRDLLEVPRWMAHANGAVGIAAVGVLAAREDWGRVRARFAGLFGADAIEEGAEGFSVRTGNGRFVVGDAAGIERLYGAVPASDGAPCCVAVHVRVRSLEAAWARLGGVDARREGERIVVDASFLGNCFLVFEA